MIDIFAETHKIIAKNFMDEIEKNYGLRLDEKSLLKGSVSPDYKLKYKVHRHYADESLDYVVDKIYILTIMARFIDIENCYFRGITNSFFSNEIGIISHYLTDFVTRPHFERWTFLDSPIKHIKYEKKLNEMAEGFDFKINYIQDLGFKSDLKNYTFKSMIKELIISVLDEYSKTEGMGNDLVFAYNLNYKLVSIVLELVRQYQISEKMEPILV